MPEKKNTVMAWDFLPHKHCPLQKEKQSHREREKPLLLPRREPALVLLPI